MSINEKNVFLFKGRGTLSGYFVFKWYSYAGDWNGRESKRNYRKPRQDATKKGQRKCKHLRLKFIRDDNSRQQVGSIDFSPWPSMPVAFGVILDSDSRWQPSYISRQIEDIPMNRKLSTFSCYPLTNTKPATRLSNYSRTKCVKS